MSRRTAESRAGIDRALRGRPRVQDAYRAGKIGLEASWLVYRALGRGLIALGAEEAWVHCARKMSVKGLRDEVRWTALGKFEMMGEPIVLQDLPTTAFEARTECHPVIREPILPSTEAEWHASIRRTPEMTRERLQWLGKLALDPRCSDAWLRLRLPEDVADNLLAAVESARQRLEQRADEVPWTEPWPDPKARASVRAAREFVVRCRRVPAWVGLLALLEDYAETWDDPRLIPKRRWTRIYERDGYRCMAPGCTARRRIQDHHIQYRSHQGSDELWNQLTLCNFHHHQGEHGQYAQVRGTAPLDVTWRLGRPDLATWWRNERRLEAPEE
jgi:hypothetical protein